MAALRLSRFNRAHSSSTADLINDKSNGSLDKKEVDIYIGDHEDSYVLIPPEVGSIFQALSDPNTQRCRSPKSPMVYHHEMNYLFHGEYNTDVLCERCASIILTVSQSDYPRLVIRQDLDVSDASCKTSPATLYHYGVMNTIDLDGTLDGKDWPFWPLTDVLTVSVAEMAELGRDVEERLRPALEKLKDM